MYLLIFLVTLAISGFATLRVKSMIAKYSQVPASSGLTGAQTAQRILQFRGIHDVTIREGDGMMGDHYNPLSKELVLSPDVYESSSTAAVGIAAHECGHAIQHQEHYVPLQLRMTAVGATQFANKLVMVLPFLFIFTRSFALIHGGLVVLAVAWGIIMLFNLITLPVEFDASRRAKVLLPSMGIIRGPAEMQGVNKVLDAAALTYVAAFLTTLGYFLYYAMMLLGGQRR